MIRVNMIIQYIFDSIEISKKFFWSIGIYILALFILGLLILYYLDYLSNFSFFIWFIISVVVIILLKIFMIKENVNEIFIGDD